MYVLHYYELKVNQIDQLKNQLFHYDTRIG